MGISEATFEARIEEEIEALLKEIEDEKTEASQQEEPPERPMTKDEVIRMIGNRDLTSGSLLGMFRWAADLGASRFNFEVELGWDQESLLLLNAYD